MSPLLLLHTAVPPATDHPYRTHASPASTTAHLASRHHLDPDGANARVFAGPEQLHRFAHTLIQRRLLLSELVTPLVEHILDLLQPLSSDVEAIVLAEVTLFTQLLDAPIHWPAIQRRDSDPPSQSPPR